MPSLSNVHAVCTLKNRLNETIVCTNKVRASSGTYHPLLSNGSAEDMTENILTGTSSTNSNKITNKPTRYIDMEGGKGK